MTDKAISELTEQLIPAYNDYLVAVDVSDVSMAPTGTDKKLKQGAYLGNLIVPGGRLTLATATPVTTTDQLAKTNVYYTPYLHDAVPIYDGVQWIARMFTELSIAVPNTTVTPFDIFIYDNAGTLTLTITDWATDAARATALVRLNGRLVKSGTPAQLYLGTGRTTAVAGQCEDSEAKRFLVNYYNTVPRSIQLYNNTNHTYNAASYRIWNNDAAVIREFVVPVAERALAYDIYGEILPVADGAPGYISAGLDSVTVEATAGASIGHANLYLLRSANNPTIAPPAAGYHYLSILEMGHVASPPHFVRAALKFAIEG